MRVSVSDVDQYLYYLKSDEMTLESLLARLKKEEAPTEAMRAGTAFHQLLETRTGELSTATVDGIHFDFALHAEIAIPEIKELKAEKRFGDITLVGKVDAMFGRTIFDHKLTSRFDGERYASAFQWRAYLAIFDATQFTYNVFTQYHQKETDTHIVKEFHPFSLYRYPALEVDVFNTLEQYAAFAEQHLVQPTETGKGGV